MSAVLLAYACGADPLFLNETDAVSTIRAEGASFTGYRTYYLPDEIVDLCLQPQEGEPTSDAIGGAAGGPSIDPANCSPTDHTSDEAILLSLAQNMDALGYERVAEDEKASADLALLAGLVSKETWTLNKPYCYPNYYYPGCVNQGAPEVVVPYNSLVLELIDVDASNGDDLESTWTASVHQIQKIYDELGTSPGGGPSSTKIIAMTEAIDQAFRQSPYLADGGSK